MEILSSLALIRDLSASVPTAPLARQEYWEIVTNFTTLLLHNYNSKSDCEDYRKN
jgi:hypothetical protein